MNNIKKYIDNEDFVIDLAELFKVFGDSTRIKIFLCLLDKEQCVGDISETINISPSAVSHQLRILKQAKLVKYRKEGTIVYYSLDDNHVKEILLKGSEHVEEI